MYRLRKTLILTLIFALISTFCACGEDGSEYKILGNSLGEHEYAVAFRSGDQLCAIVDAALKVLKANGAVGDISRVWFGKDITKLEGDENALEDLGEIPPRALIMGLDAGKAPFSFMDESGAYRGFDIDLAVKVCALLGWELKFQPIKSEEAAIQLNSGNIDCAWGGMSFDDISDKLSVTASYLESETVLVVKSDSGINSKKKLNDKTLAMTFDPCAGIDLEFNTDIKSRLGSVKKLSSVKECFETLLSGNCDVILVDRLSAEYYM